MKTINNRILNLDYKSSLPVYSVATKANIGDKVLIEQNESLKSGEVLSVSPRGCQVLFVDLNREFICWKDILEIVKKEI
jgi:hypothetical protein